MQKNQCDDLMQRAAAAARNAYCPYSGYHVGAALLAADGSIFSGCNVENASYGLTVCAERTAVFSAVAAGVRSFSAMAVVADGDQYPYPCGACRQVVAEFCGPEFLFCIAPVNKLEAPQQLTLAQLLPHSFFLNEAGDK